MLHNTAQHLLIAKVTASINNFMISCPIKPAILFQRPAQFFVFCKDTITFWPRLKAYLYNDTVFSVNMMTSPNGNIFRVTGHLSGEFTGPGEFPTQRPVTRSCDVSLTCALINWVNNRKAGDLKRHRAQYDVTVMNSMYYEVSVITGRNIWSCIVHCKCVHVW